jgi:predicted ATP-dependent endonuclease of OLD family
MHVDLQRKFFNYLNRLAKAKEYQFFILTHSAAFIDSSIISFNNSKVYRVFKTAQNTSKVEPINSEDSKWRLITEELGYKPSDLLLSNTIIWVEGPTDVIYIKRWIREWLSKDENSLNKIVEGRDYTFMFYGGILLSNLAYSSNETTDEDINNFVDLCLINRNVALILDSDRKSSKQPLVSWKNKMLKRFDQEKQTDLHIWTTNCLEIENYLSKETFVKAYKKIYKRKKVPPYGQFKKLTYNDYKKKETKNFKKKKFSEVAISEPVDFGVWELGKKVNDLIKWISKRALKS